MIQRRALIADYKLSGGKGTIDPDKINRELLAFYQYVKQEYPRAEIPYIFPDCAEQTLITGIRLFMMKNHIRVAVTDSYKGRINDRIYALNGLMTQGRFKVHSSCKNVIDFLSSQCWDPKKLTEDVRLDDGTFDIDIHVESFLYNPVKSILFIGHNYIDPKIDLNTKISVIFDQSPLIDENSERLRDRDDVSAGLMAKWEYRVKWYGETEEQARAAIEDIEGGQQDDDTIMGFGDGG